MNGCIDLLGNAAGFPAPDANSGYRHKKFDEADRNKTGFTSHHSLYRLIQMTFALRNASGTFQRTTDVILRAVKWQFTLVYLDNMVVF